MNPLNSSWKSVLDQFQVALSRFEESYGYHANQHEKLMLRLTGIGLEKKSSCSLRLENWKSGETLLY